MTKEEVIAWRLIAGAGAAGIFAALVAFILPSPGMVLKAAGPCTRPMLGAQLTPPK
jgi:hypothetical protein